MYTLYIMQQKKYTMTIYLNHIHLIYFQLPAATRHQNVPLCTIDRAPRARSATSLKAPPETLGVGQGRLLLV